MSTIPHPEDNHNDKIKGDAYGKQRKNNHSRNARH